EGQEALVQREETSSFGSSCKVEKLNFQFEGYLGSSTSLFWNTQLISNRQPTQQRGPTGVYLSQERIVTFPYEWQEFRSEILLDLQEGRKVQMWVLREAEIPETLEEELKHHCIEWVLVPSRYEEFQRFFQKAWQSPVKSWSLALLPSVDSRDAWLSPELAVDCMETLGRENFSAR